ncbi:putative metallo-hydrolase [Variibacter gotjawalensis]|uniref:Putative metallo-hydrolase n=1 Tax=Variibacter gotjawalensis TaxID=1333996 RepID=A0A0S3PTB8_9BRAD|nr:MBL fold metallo-hydrolase [Variibacter gotjawalensis]NIK49453.1 glyoxylase-like metal-dependent hydrolase (beta-lactamase superfamily II) [Variibacter gotjawalensis]RZS51305.1 glyoxylase-like metal-dependent hydrolase (beta-lactamase superfamily II) [Variibacter gotjawalensis]BAT59138.1 putative metallo-hydrolase [Variibacter gotjawalensis]
MPKIQAAIVPVTLFQQNCTLLWDKETDHGVVVDPGGDIDQILAAIEENQITIDKILLTHGHIDHAGAAAELKERLNVPIEGPHKAEAIMLANLDKQGVQYGIPARPVTPDRWLEDGDTVEAAGVTFKIRHCPGHSPGSVVFINEEQKFALVGDVLFAGSVGRSDLPGGDHDTLIRSIKEKLLPLEDDVTFICGHGPVSTIGRERATNPFLR